MSVDPDPSYDAVLIVAFGGPEGPGDVLPFLHNVTSGRDVPTSRLERVAANYQHLGGQDFPNAFSADYYPVDLVNPVRNSNRMACILR